MYEGIAVMDSSMTAASPDENALLSRLESVLGVLAAGNRFALAYSGGLDSRFLAHAAQRFGSSPYCAISSDRTFRRKIRTMRVIGRPPGISLMRNFPPIHWIQLWWPPGIAAVVMRASVTCFPC